MRPERPELGDDALTEQVAGPRERERGVRVQALEPGATSVPGDPRGQLRPQCPLLRVRCSEAPGELRLATPDYRQKLADGIVNAVRAYRDGR